MQLYITAAGIKCILETGNQNMAKKKAKKKAIGKKKKVTGRKKVSKKKASKKKASKKKAKKKGKATGAKPPTKSEILSQIAEETELSKGDVSAVFESLTGIIEQNLAGRPALFNMPGLFKMKRINVKAKPKRKGINPFTGEEQMFKAKPASKKVKIYPLKGLKEMV